MAPSRKLEGQACETRIHNEGRKPTSGQAGGNPCFETKPGKGESQNRVRGKASKEGGRDCEAGEAERTSIEGAAMRLPGIVQSRSPNLRARPREDRNETKTAIRENGKKIGSRKQATEMEHRTGSCAEAEKRGGTERSRPEGKPNGTESVM
jgi:hypothetical protein